MVPGINCKELFYRSYLWHLDFRDSHGIVRAIDRGINFGAMKSIVPTALKKALNAIGMANFLAQGFNPRK